MKMSGYFVFITLIFTSFTYAHCDAENGPVAKAAIKSLDTGEFSHVAIWVGSEQEEELKAKFQKALEVYKNGEEAGELAKRYFMETAVRLHREAEGMPYTGLKPAMKLPADVEAAEKALEQGNVQPVMEILKNNLESNVNKWFDKAIEAKKEYNGNDVEAGREYVDAYVKYVIYVHTLHKTIEAGPAHGVGE